MFQDTQDGPSERDTNAAGRKRASPSGGKKADRAKRVRVSRACDQCRAGREKCDGAQPTCQTCETQNRSCTYNEQPKKRGIQPNYIRTLELTLAWLLQNYPGCEVKLSHLLPDPNENVHQIIAFKEANASEALHTVWRNGIICRQIDQLLSGAAIEIPQHGQDDPDEHGQTAHQMPLVGAAGNDFAGNQLPYNSPPQSAPSDGNAVPHDVQGSGDLRGLLSPTPGPFNHHQQPNATILKLPSNAWSLLEDYFTFTQTWLPITEKHDILRMMYSYPAAGLSRVDADSSEHAELWSIMAWSAARIGGETTTEMSRCRDIARSLIPKEANVDLGHIKALLILGIIDLASGTLPSAWLTIGTAIRVMVHLTSSESAETKLSGDRLRHTYLAAFVLESTIASQTGALTHLRPENITSVGSLVEDGLDEWSPWQDPAGGSSLPAEKPPARSISTFNELVRMAMRRTQSLIASPQSPQSQQELSIIFELLRNGSARNNRLHPSTIVNSQRSLTTEPSQSQLPTAGPSKISHGRTQSSQMDLWNPQTLGSPDMSTLGQQYPFMSIPNETTESLPGSTPAQMTVPTATSLWPGEASGSQIQEPFDPAPTGPSSGGGDIFEELAMLDRTDSTQKPNFMENLGFGPDLDLAEFFGADYQPSDPLLAYMQPHEFGDFAQPYEDIGKDAG